MLRKIQAQEFPELSEFVYNLSLDLSRTSFPVYTDGIKTKQQFLKRSEDGIHRSDEEILVFEKNGSTEGWIHYYVIPSDKYLGICSMSIRSGYAEAFDELLAYWKGKYPQYHFSLYFPEENHDIMRYMSAHDYQDLSQEVVDVLLFRNYELHHESENVTRIGSDNFDVFQEIHQQFEDEMYWNSDRIKDAIDDWMIFAYKQQGRYLGAIYYNGIHNADCEIFGLDLSDDCDKAVAAEELLIASLNAAKRDGANSMYFFNDAEIHTITSRLGFQCVTIAHYFEDSL